MIYGTSYGTRRFGEAEAMKESRNEYMAKLHAEVLSWHKPVEPTDPWEWMEEELRRNDGTSKFEEKI